MLGNHSETEGKRAHKGWIDRKLNELASFVQSSTQAIRKLNRNPSGWWTLSSRSVYGDETSPPITK